MLTYQFGEIVLVRAVLDPQGRNPKDRPAVVLQFVQDRHSQSAIEVMAITTLIPVPMPEDYVLLPWQQPRHPRTGLNKRCAAVGGWLTTIDPTRIVRLVGIVPSQQKFAIASLLDQFKKEADPKET